LAFVVGLVVLLVVLPGTKSRIKMSRIQTGMTVSEVLEIGQPWLICRLKSMEPRPGARSMELRPQRVEVPETKASFTFASVAELGQFVSKEMDKAPGRWIMVFGFITMSPQRIYFSIEFGPDGRVVRKAEGGFADATEDHPAEVDGR
jgi:hypothetical protein